MHSLEKLEKKGFYVIHLGYETIIEQSILKGLVDQKEIPTFNRELADEFSPGKHFLTYLSGLQLVKTVKMDWLLSKSGLKYSRILGSLIKLVPKDVLFKKFFEDMMYVALYTMRSKNVGSMICGDIDYPVWMAKIINQTVIRRIEDQKFSKSQKTLNMIMRYIKNAYSYGIMKALFNKPPRNFVDDTIFEDIIYAVEHYFMSMTGSLVLYPTLAAGTVVLQHILCRKIGKNILTLEVKSSEFNKVLKAVVAFLNEKKQQKNHFRVLKEYTETVSTSSHPISVMAIKVNSKPYHAENDVANQIPLLIKDLLKKLPQNVFVRKVEYFGFEEDDGLIKINTEESSSNDKNRKDIFIARMLKKEMESSERNNNKHSPFDVIQTIYSNVPKEINLQNHKLTSVDQNIIRYSKQHYELYRFINRKQFSRKYLLNVISNRMKPSSLSPMIPHAYELHLMNNTEEPLKLYFYNEEKQWFKHLRTIKAPIDERESRNSVLNDIYVVKLYLKQFVQKYMQNILDDIPKGLSIIEVFKPVDDKHTPCSSHRIFPKTKGECQLPPRDHSEIDKQLVNAVIERARKNK